MSYESSKCNRCAESITEVYDVQKKKPEQFLLGLAKPSARRAG
jgi:hypothetical protein